MPFAIEMLPLILQFGLVIAVVGKGRLDVIGEGRLEMSVKNTTAFNNYLVACPPYGNNSDRHNDANIEVFPAALVSQT
ncbi:MAG: hypothetical protein F6K04_02845 [Leptolyngbya sp. SIO4C5]|nr:hypothetical protein [Leptolyngbya sp. SIO4C5]